MTQDSSLIDDSPLLGKEDMLFLQELAPTSLVPPLLGFHDLMPEPHEPGLDLVMEDVADRILHWFFNRF